VSGLFKNSTSLNLVNNGTILFPTVTGPYQVSSSPGNFWTGNRFNTGATWVSMLANGDVQNNAGITWAGTMDIATKSNYRGGGLLDTSSNSTNDPSGGSIIIKAGNEIIQSPQSGIYGTFLNANGNLWGGAIQISALHDFFYDALNANAKGPNSAISANGSLQGGMINVQAGDIISIQGGTNPTLPALPYSQVISADGTGGANGWGGMINLHAGNTNTINNVQVEANGGLRNGTVITTTGL